MEKLLKGVSFLIILLLFMGLSACSDSPTSNNNKSTTTTKNAVKSLSGPLGKPDCNRPLDVLIANASFQSKGNYILTYSWNSANNATGYEFELLINGTVAFQNLTVTDTFITFPQSIAATDVINASVKTICGTTSSSSSKVSAEINYLNSIATDDLVFLVTPTTSVTDICSKTCDKLKFTSSSLLNSNGTAITLNNFAMQVYYYDFDAVKTCIQCTPGGGAPVVDPSVFNACLQSPLNQYWLYDPNAYTVCP